MDIRTRRVYDEPAKNDGFRVLVDRLWPRGVTKEAAAVDAWMKSLSPSNELRRWYDHDPERWDEFRERYFAELDEHARDDGELAELIERVRAGRVTLVYSTRAETRNNAEALREYLLRAAR